MTVLSAMKVCTQRGYLDEVAPFRCGLHRLRALVVFDA